MPITIVVKQPEEQAVSAKELEDGVIYTFISPLTHTVDRRLYYFSISNDRILRLFEGTVQVWKKTDKTFGKNEDTKMFIPAPIGTVITIQP